VSADFVRVDQDRSTDFTARFGATSMPFEATLADLSGRKLGLEYRTNQWEPDQRGYRSRLLHDPVEAWIERAEQAPVVLRDASVRKLAKRYAAKPSSLVIYLNISEFGIRQREIEACMPSSTAIAKDAFKDIWVLWKDRAYLTWRNGHRPNRSSSALAA
jgi:hypothetical protein